MCLVPWMAPRVMTRRLCRLMGIAKSLKGINESLHALTGKGISCTADGFTMIERHLGELASGSEADQATKKRKSG